MMTRRFNIAAMLAAIALAGASTTAFAHDETVSASQVEGQPALAEGLAIETYPILESPHVEDGPVPLVLYNSNPPTSGPHNPAPAPLGVYDQPVPDWIAVHDLEHGSIWITYTPALDEASVERLVELANHYPNAVILSPRPSSPAPVTVVSWGQVMKLDGADIDKIDRYVRAFVNNSPEKFSSLDHEPARPPEKPMLNAAIPGFGLVDVDGREITNDTFQDRPYIVWFTTGWCTPCQIGARRVAKLDDDLGGSAFDVLVVFVDPRETEADLREWRDEFANPDWIVAFDDPDQRLAGQFQVQYLDTKFLVGPAGKLLDVDVRIADRPYISRIARTVQSGSN